jgi:putative oxidoreductase
MNGQAGSEPKLLFPGLAGFYAVVSDLWYPMIRVIAGALLLYHGWDHLNLGVGPLAASLAKGNFIFPTVLAIIIMILETVGATAVALGLFTRFFAAAIAIEMAVIAFVAQMPRGFGRMELFLIWGTVMFAIALRGGGPYSLDRKIGKEL